MPVRELGRLYPGRYSNRTIHHYPCSRAVAAASLAPEKVVFGVNTGPRRLVRGPCCLPQGLTTTKRHLLFDTFHSSSSLLQSLRGVEAQRTWVDRRHRHSPRGRLLASPEHGITVQARPTLAESGRQCLKDPRAELPGQKTQRPLVLGSTTCSAARCWRGHRSLLLFQCTCVQSQRQTVVVSEGQCAAVQNLLQYPI